MPPLASNSILSFLSATASRIRAGLRLSLEFRRRRELVPDRQPRLRFGCLVAPGEAAESGLQNWRVPQGWSDDYLSQAPCRINQNDDCCRHRQARQLFPASATREWFFAYP